MAVLLQTHEIAHLSSNETCKPPKIRGKELESLQKEIQDFDRSSCSSECLGICDRRGEVCRASD